jgi:hypothetical protein
MSRVGLWDAGLDSRPRTGRSRDGPDLMLLPKLDHQVRLVHAPIPTGPHALAMGKSVLHDHLFQGFLNSRVRRISYLLR